MTDNDPRSRKVDGVMAALERRMRHLPIPPDDVRARLIAAITDAPKLVECADLHHAVHRCLMLGMLPGPEGYIYLIPRYDKRQGGQSASVQVGYRGLLHLLHESADIESLDDGLVYEQEVRDGRFIYERGLRTVLEHRPDPEYRADPNGRDIVAAWARVTLYGRKGAGPSTYCVVLRQAELEIAERRGDRVWQTDRAAMIRKTPWRRLLSGGLVPIDPTSRLARVLAIESDAEIEAARQQRREAERQAAASIQGRAAPAIEQRDEDVSYSESIGADDRHADAITIEQQQAEQQRAEQPPQEPAKAPPAKTETPWQDRAASVLPAGRVALLGDPGAWDRDALYAEVKARKEGRWKDACAGMIADLSAHGWDAAMIDGELAEQGWSQASYDRAIAALADLRDPGAAKQPGPPAAEADDEDPFA